MHFDSWAGESFYNDKMQPVIDELREKGLLVESEGAQIAEKTAVKLSAGESLSLAATEDAAAQILVMSAPALGEPIAWHGPIVMNSLADIAKASVELRNGTFLKHEIKY